MSILIGRMGRAAEPLVDNDFNLDPTTGPVLASDRVVAMGGAFGEGMQ